MEKWRNLETDKDPREMDLCTFCHPSPRYGTTPPVLYEDDEVYVMPALGQFTEGYLLLIHQDHVDCFGDAANGHVDRVKDRIRDVLVEEYGACTFYEHGRTGSCLTRGQARICYHAHIHCVPMAENFTDRIEQDFDRVPVDEWPEIADHYEDNPHYLYLETDDGEKSFFIAEENIERQYLRKRACEALGFDEEEANWADNPYWDRIYDTVADLRDAIPESDTVMH